jgi:hypothetical protein
LKVTPLALSSSDGRKKVFSTGSYHPLSTHLNTMFGSLSISRAYSSSYCSRCNFSLFLTEEGQGAADASLMVLFAGTYCAAVSLFAAACCGCNPAAAAASTVFFSLWIAAAAIQTAATVSACSQPNTPSDRRRGPAGPCRR